MNERIRELSQRIQEIASENLDRNSQDAETLAGMLNSAYALGELGDHSRTQETLQMTREGISMLVLRLGEDDERARILQEMYAMLSDQLN
jgi:hypothetical protein